LNIGVIFDMDGVLVDSGPAHKQSWRQLALEFANMEISDEKFDASFGRRSREIIAEWFGITDTAHAKRLDDRKESLYRDLIRGRVPAMPGAVELVRSLHEAGCLIAVGSSGPPENVNLVCDEMGLRPFLSACVTGEDVTRGKPDPQVYQVAAERLCLPADRCLVIEDAPAGIEAARRAGMACIGLSGSHPAESLAAANQVVARLSDITKGSIETLIDKCGEKWG
jgi:beta-phosphoglucomutase